MTTDKFIKDYYDEFYNSKDTEGRRMLTNQINAILEAVPAKSIVMALVVLIQANTAMLDAKELNQ